MPLNLMLPGNPRYQPKQLVDYFGYDYLYRELAAVEIATLRTLDEIGIIPDEEMAFLTQELIDILMGIPTTVVDELERKVTKHDVRAWIRIAQEHLGPLARWLHVPLTSYDPLDTARIIQFLKAYRHALKPSIKRIVELYVVLVRKLAAVLQIGRTHGQHALPITVGFWLATILSRIVENWKKMDVFSNELVGKITGAVGACNAQVGLGFCGRCGSKSFEERVLEKVGLRPARISTQILAPEHLAYFLYSCAMLSSVFGQMGRDCRNLMRTEIAEIGEPFEEGQVGSSTMAQKRNPINFEQLEGKWLCNIAEFLKVMLTLISEHQRDLVGSSVARDFPTILVNLQTQMNALLREDDKGRTFLERLTVNEEACRKNFNMSRHNALAEPLYICMQMAGYKGDAHKLVNEKLVKISTSTGKLLVDVLEEYVESDIEAKEAFDNIPKEMLDLLHHPENYTGNAEQKALEIADYAEATAKALTN